MAELKCPHCGQAFTVDDAELGSIIAQIRDSEFEKDLTKRTKELEEHLQEKHALELSAQENEIKLQVKEEHDEELQKVQEAPREPAHAGKRQRADAAGTER